MPGIFKKPAVDSFPAYFFFAFIAMAGLSYINFLPGLVNALAGGIDFSEVEAGQIVALNGYGGVVGSVLAIFLVRWIQWRESMLILLAVLAVTEISTAWINTLPGDQFHLMLGWRFFAGFVGGLNVGIGFSVLARLSNPDRAFGFLLLVQFSVGSLVIYLLPMIEALVNAYAVFYVMAGFVLFALVFLLFVPDVSLVSQSRKQPAASLPWFGNAILLLLGIMLYQSAASAIWAYIGLIGFSAGIAEERVSLYVAMTGMLGLLGAMLPVLMGDRLGRLKLVVAGVVLSATAVMLLSYFQSTAVYVVSMAVLFFSWPAVLSYLLAVTADLDGSGRLSTTAGVVSSVGLASGPLLAASLLNEDGPSIVLYICAIIFSLALVLLFKPVRAQETTYR